MIENPCKKSNLINVDIIIQKFPHIFNLNISIDKAESGAYRTIVLQTTQTKRLTAVKFFKKNFKKQPQVDF